MRLLRSTGFFPLVSFSTRANIVAKRTYSRIKEDGSYETWPEVITRVTNHQRWLWERALNRHLNNEENLELRELRLLMLDRRALVSGRTLWLGGTELVKKREAANFNCSFLNVHTTHDVVDAFWLLLNGCGVGFKPIPGILNGFMRPHEIEIIRSTRNDKGDPNNKESYSEGVWTIQLGDSGESWSKAIGKILAGKYAAKLLRLDFSQIRPSGTRLLGYGWVSSGDTVIAEEFPKICAILNRRAGRLLTHIDILDILNHLGVVQTGRRGAEIALYDYGSDDWESFASAKHNFWTTGNPQRSQSNNSLVFWEQPSSTELQRLLRIMEESGGSEPGLINGELAKKRAPYYAGNNPCAEILLADRGFCNLVEVNVAAFSDLASLERAIYLISRANYRQTQVNLDDGILQRSWHENNQFLRLCGVGLTGLVMRPDLLNPSDLMQLRRTAAWGAYAMAAELGTQPPKNITTVKPSGTLSKIMDVSEGAHRPLGQFIFNAITFTKSDPLVQRLRDCGYRVFDNPLQADGVAVVFPVESPSIAVRRESAVEQLERYKLLANSYTDHNCSITISYGNDELGSIQEWLEKNWDSYIGVSFLPRAEIGKLAEEMGYPYLPQEIVDEKRFKEYAGSLKPLEDDDISGSTEMLDVEECSQGVCPVR